MVRFIKTNALLLYLLALIYVGLGYWIHWWAFAAWFGSGAFAWLVGSFWATPYVRKPEGPVDFMLSTGLGSWTFACLLEGFLDEARYKLRGRAIGNTVLGAVAALVVLAAEAGVSFGLYTLSWWPVALFWAAIGALVALLFWGGSPLIAWRGIVIDVVAGIFAFAVLVFLATVFALELADRRRLHPSVVRAINA